MELFFTPSAIFLATIAGFAVGMVWFSPVLFMKAWMQGEGITKEQLPKRSTLYMVQTHLYSFIAHGAMAAVLAILFDVLAVNSLELAIVIALLLTLGFVVSTKFIEMVYTVHGKHFEKRMQLRFLVNAGYYLVVAVVMASVLFATVS
jgi:hypothetical protein